jgi:hypothetical protein
MRHPALTRTVLIVSGLIALTIGGAILCAPAAFHTSNDIHFGDNNSLLSETRAAAGALLTTGVLMTLGAFVPRLTFSAALVGAMTYLAYGLSRLLSLMLDGVPASGITVAAAVELVIGVACVLVLPRSGSSSARARPSVRRSGGPASEEALSTTPGSR